MNVSAPLRVAIVGCGQIAGLYVNCILQHLDALQLIGVFDLDHTRAEQLAAKFQGRVYSCLDQLLTDERVEVVVNLTTHRAHVEVIARSLEAGKNVYTEKPLALSGEDAWWLVELAQQRGLRLASAPISFLGEAQQEAMRVVRSGELGKVRVVYADMNWNRFELWHPAPQGFLQVGSMFDVGVYPLTTLTALFGPVVSVQAWGEVLMPERQTQSGEAFNITTPDWVCAWLHFACGVRCRLTTSFYAGFSTQTGIEYHGDEAVLHIGGDYFNSPLKKRGRKEMEWKELPLPAGTQPGPDWARGLVELSHAMSEERPHRADASRAAHVVEVVTAIHRAVETGQSQQLKPAEFLQEASEQTPCQQ